MSAAVPRGLWNRGFISLLATQFFEAASDNVIKGTLSFAVAFGAPWEHAFGTGGNGIVGLVFVLPFILLSAFGGRIADRHSKSRVTIVLKTVSLAVAAFTALVCLGLHSLVDFNLQIPANALSLAVLLALPSGFSARTSAWPAYCSIMDFIVSRSAVERRSIIQTGFPLVPPSESVRR